MGDSYSYKNFVRDIISGDIFIQSKDAIDKNAHNVNLSRLCSLLPMETLVRKYFDKDHFTDEDCTSLINEFKANRTSGQSASSTDANGTVVPSLECNLNAEQIAIITDAANKIPVFDKTVSKEQIKALFDGTSMQPLRAYKNRYVALFFDQLCADEVISGRWMKAIGMRGVILSSQNGKPLTSGLLSSALHQSKQTPVLDRTKSIIREMAREVARIQEKTRKDTH